MRQLSILLNRFKMAFRFGCFFCGTRFFRIPRQIHYRKKKSFLVVPEDHAIRYDFINIFLDDDYGLEKMDSRPERIIDVGANVGLFSLYAALKYPEAVIHAYEPNGGVVDYLKQNLERTNVCLFEEAVGERDQEEGVSLSQETSSRLVRTKQGGDIPCVSLETAVERMGGNVDLLKLDCEGAEWEIFKNENIFQFIKAIRMEYHLVDGHSEKDLKSTVKKLGYTVEKFESNDGFGILWLTRSSKR